MENANFIFVKCPSCSKTLKFRAIPNFREGTITCPHCGAKSRVRDILIENPASQGQPVRKDDSTNVIGDETRIVGAKAFIRCLTNGVETELKPGQNSIGRQAARQQASITFDDPDMYMSRLHATITFVTSPAPALHLKDESSANGTFINDVKIPAGSIVKLLPGTRFTMGNMEFECRVEESPTRGYARGIDNDQTTMS